MGAAQADDTDDAIAIRAGHAICPTIDQPVQTEPRFREAGIIVVGQHIEFGGARKRNAVLGNVSSVLGWVEFDVRVFFVVSFY